MAAIYNLLLIYYCCRLFFSKLKVKTICMKWRNGFLPSVGWSVVECSRCRNIVDFSRPLLFDVAISGWSKLLKNLSSNPSLQLYSKEKHKKFKNNLPKECTGYILLQGYLERYLSASALYRCMTDTHKFIQYILEILIFCKMTHG